MPQGSIAPGTVTQDKATGALVFIEATQEYLLIAPHLVHKLNTCKVRAAIHQAQTPPDTPESWPHLPVFIVKIPDIRTFCPVFWEIFPS